MDLRIISKGKVPPNHRTKDIDEAWKLKKTFQSYKQRVNPMKEVGKWCVFHKSSTHNTSECRVKQSLVDEIKASESDAYSDTESKIKKGNDRGKKIIDAYPNATVATTKIQKEEPEDS